MPASFARKRLTLTSTATVAANCTPSKTYIQQIMQACDELPVNYGIIGKGSDSDAHSLHEQCKAGIAALKLHEDWGCTPAAIDTCLRLLHFIWAVAGTNRLMQGLR